MEYEPLGLDADTYNRIIWGKKIGKQRGNGRLASCEAIADRIWSLLPVETTEEMRTKALEGKKFRMKKALTEIDPVILETLEKLKSEGFKIGLISNADAFDDLYWPKSPLKPYFDDAIFSYRVRLLKPDRRIYKLSLKNLGVSAKEAVFVGDGGSSEHKGARKCGISTVWTEYLHKWDEQTRKEIENYADARIENFGDLNSIIKR